MSLASRCPNNITLKPREGVFRSPLDNEARSINAHVYFDLSCEYGSSDKAARDELDGYHTWQALGWFDDIGLAGFVARKKGNAAHQYAGRTAAGEFVSKSSTEFEIQPTPDQISIDCTDPAFPNQSGTLINTTSLQLSDLYDYRTMTSQRQRRTKKRLGKTALFAGDLKFSRSRFAEFVTWYRCHLMTGGGKFYAPWLANNEFGFWAAIEKSPWSAVYKSGRWTVSVDWALLWDETIPAHPLNNPADPGFSVAVADAIAHPAQHVSWLNDVLANPGHPAYEQVSIADAQSALDFASGVDNALVLPACPDVSCLDSTFDYELWLASEALAFAGGVDNALTMPACPDLSCIN